MSKTEGSHWIYIRPGDFIISFLFFATAVCILIISELSSATPLWDMDSLETSFTWLRYCYLILFGLSSIKVLLIPAWNLFVAVTANKGRRRPLQMILSVFPLGYEAKLNSAKKLAMKDVPLRDGLCYSSSSVHLPPVTKRKFIKIHTATKFTFLDPFFTANAGVPHGTVNVILSNEKEVKKAKSQWLPKFRSALVSRLSESAYPLGAIEFVEVKLHSEEEIRKVGEYGYWA